MMILPSLSEFFNSLLFFINIFYKPRLAAMESVSRPIHEVQMGKFFDEVARLRQFVSQKWSNEPICTNLPVCLGLKEPLSLSGSFVAGLRKTSRRDSRRTICILFRRKWRAEQLHVLRLFSLPRRRSRARRDCARSSRSCGNMG